MSIKLNKIKEMIQKKLPDAFIKLEDFKGDGNHYNLLVISKKFVGKTRIIQHKMVYSALQNIVGYDLHALSIKTIPYNK